MDTSVEAIMTGDVQIESVLKSNKDKIQSLTSELELIIRKGYFEIIRNTEILQSLSPSQSIPKIQIPKNLSFVLPENPQKPETIEDKIWALLNQNQFIQATDLILKSTSPSARRIGKLLKSPEFFNVFDLDSEFLDRISSFLKLEKPENESIEISKFVARQLKIQNSLNFDEIFEKCRIIFKSFIDPSEEATVKQIIGSDLQLFFSSVSESLVKELQKTTKIEELARFISKYSTSYGIPTIWDLISNDWRATARKLIYKNCEFRAFGTLKETLENYEKNTKSSVELLASSPSLLESLESDLCQHLISSIPQETSPVLQLAFFSNLSELSLFKILPQIDFSSFVYELKAKVAEMFQNKDILQICMEIRAICGEKTLNLEGLELNFGPSQSGFGDLVGLSASSSFPCSPSLPEPLSTKDLLGLPIALSTHLLLS